MQCAAAARASSFMHLEWRRYAPLLAVLVAMWPVGQWLAVRATHDVGDAWALLSLATAMAVLWHDRPKLASAHWGVTAAAVLAYVFAYPFAPPLVRAMLAMTAVAAACSTLWYGRRLDIRLWGLLLLSVPLVPSLNFYFGYPLRVAVGEATAALLQLNGFAVVREGTILLWNAQQVSIDAPCSGIKMLWTGAYLCCALAAFMRLDARRTILLGSVAFAIVMTANALRATALFYVEAGIVPQAQRAHEPIGVIVFALAAVSIALAAIRLRDADAPNRMRDGTCERA